MSRPTCSVTRSTSSCARSSGVKCRPGGRRGRGAGGSRVDRLIPGRVREGLGDVGRQRRRAGRLAREAEPPAAFAEVLEELDRAVRGARFQPARRPGEALPLVAAEALEEQHLAARRLDRDTRGHDARVVHDNELGMELRRQLGERAVPRLPCRAVVDEQPRRVPLRRRPLRDQLRRQLVVQLRHVHDGHRRASRLRHDFSTVSGTTHPAQAYGALPRASGSAPCLTHG